MVSGYVRTEPPFVVRIHVALSLVMGMGTSCLDCARRGGLVGGQARGTA